MALTAPRFTVDYQERFRTTDTAPTQAALLDDRLIEACERLSEVFAHVGATILHVPCHVTPFLAIHNQCVQTSDVVQWYGVTTAPTMTVLPPYIPLHARSGSRFAVREFAFRPSRRLLGTFSVSDFLLLNSTNEFFFQELY